MSEWIVPSAEYISAAKNIPFSDENVIEVVSRERENQDYIFRKHMDEFGHVPPTLNHIMAYTSSRWTFFRENSFVTVGEVAHLAIRNPFSLPSYGEDHIDSKSYQHYRDNSSLSWAILLSGVPQRDRGKFRSFDFDEISSCVAAGVTDLFLLRKVIDGEIDLDIAVNLIGSD